MAKPTPKLINAILTAAEQIEQGGRYEWGHMGGCNCGHLAQNLTDLSRAQIHEFALQKGTGDWSEQVEGYCESSGMDMDLLIAELLGHGLTREDLINLERLSDRRVLERMLAKDPEPPAEVLPPPAAYPRHNDPHDTARYMRTWASLLTEELAPTA